ncbi:N-acetylglutamate kinase [Pilibacter termitis]|uniref:Acetylglutamate kinase n=1 Tax=Pilibacter termitis TaxID=263852 RepID=A0A1T4MRY3_9ENTE|nr:acetylglutamate kinase [Pilibacter termitis]SJZ69535.1 N-acetylglutamate kinase [Pilibacter termitis]
MEQRQLQAKILIEALPYMQRFDGKTIVIKYGGSAMSNEELKKSVMQDIILLQMIGVNVVIVHGGGAAISKALDLHKIEHQFLDGLRVTGKEAMEVVASTLIGQVNKSLVQYLSEKGAKALGLSGVDGRMIEATQLNEKLGYVGKITNIHPEVIEIAFSNKFIPIIAPIAMNKNGDLLNVNADTAAVEIAAALKAEKFILLTDVRGVMKDKDDPETFIPRMTVSEVKESIANGTIQGGMIPKVQAGIHAMQNGLKEMTIIDGRIKHSILLELFSDVGIGTLIKKDE